MGRIFTIVKPQRNLGIKSTLNIRVDSKISQNELCKLKELIEKSRKCIKEELTVFSDKTFLNDSENKSKMNFRIVRGFVNKNLVGYSLGYCKLENLNEFYIDVVYVDPECRKIGFGFNMIVKLINSIIDISNINTLKFITQVDNEDAIKLIDKINTAAKKGAQTK